MTENRPENAAAEPAAKPKRRRSRLVPGIPRRRRKGSGNDPWQLQLIRGLAPTLVVVGFLAVGMALAVLAYDVTGSEAVAVLGGGVGLGLAILLTPRVAARVLDYFS